MEAGNGVSGQSASAAGPRLKRPTRPDNKETRRQTEKLTAEINRCADRIKAIKSTLDGRRRSGPQAGSKESALMRKLDELKADFQRNVNQKQSVRGEMNRVNETRESLRQQVKALKDKFRTLNVEDIDAQIKKLENKINHTTLTNREEVDAINQIKQLAKSRETVRGHRQQLDKMQEDDKLMEELVGKLKMIDQELDKIKAQEGKTRSELATLRAERAGESNDAEALIQERQENWDIMSALKNKRKEIEEEFSVKMDAFRKEEAIYREKMAEERKQREQPRAADFEKNKAEREAKKLEYEANKKNIKKEDDLLLCDQLLAYLGRYIQEKTEEAKAAESMNYEAPAEGMRLVKKGEPEEEEESSWMFKGKGAGKKGGKGKRVKNVGEKPTEKKLNHTLDIMSAFHLLRVTVPNNVSEVPQAIEAVQKRRKDIEEGQSPPQQATSSASNAAVKDGQNVENENKTSVQDQDVSDTSQNSPAEDVEANSGENDDSAQPSNGHSGKEEFPPLGGMESEALGVGA